MTREEAIEWFKGSTFYSKDHEPFNMTIKALEQEPCDDSISRQAVKDLIKSGICTDTYDDMEYVCGLIDDLPSVTPAETQMIGDKT